MGTRIVVDPELAHNEEAVMGEVPDKQVEAEWEAGLGGFEHNCGSLRYAKR